MSGSRNPNNYDPIFFQLAQLKGERLPYRMQFSHRNAAESFRFRWYHFLNALRATGHHLKQNAEGLIFCLDGSTLIINSNGMEEARIMLARDGLLPQTQITQQQLEPSEEELNRLTTKRLTPESQDEALAAIFGGTKP